MAASKQTTDGTDYTSSYVYNLSGALIEQTYPSGQKVKNVLDHDGDLSLVQSRKNSSSGYWAYARGFTYNAAGAVTSMQLGNGRWESTTFNSRLQPTQIALGVTQGATNLLKLDYSYGTTANNGNVLSQTITVPTVGTNTGFSAVQTYNYDSLNRLKDATEMLTPHGGSQSQSWKQTFTFDRYGNRRFDFTNGNTTLPDPNCAEAICNPTISASNNRLTSSGWQYDAAGNTTADAEGRQFTYDAENKQVEVENGSSQLIGQYYFDGDGKRVKKYVPSTGEVTIFVYDAGAKLIGEYSTIVETQNPKVQYLTNDHLGSPRINTDQNGHLTSRTDYMPYGEEIVGLGNRTANENYVTDDVRQGFTGYESDAETGLEYAKARMYATSLGRFSGSHPLHASAKSLNPQSWNRFSYVMNRVFVAVDPDGLSTIIVVVKGKDDDGNPRARISHVSGAGRILSGYHHALAAGSGRDRTKKYNDTPFGTYRFGGTDGGKGKKLGEAWGTGRVKMVNDSGEAVDNKRDGFYIHGGGSGLNLPYDDNQNLTATVGCIRTTNAAVNELIESAEKVANVDPVDRIFVGDEQTLIALADEKDDTGAYSNPDLRISLGVNGYIPMSDDQRKEWEQSDVRRKVAERERKKSNEE